MDVRKTIEYLKLYWDTLTCLVRKKFIRPKKLSELTFGEIIDAVRGAIEEMEWIKKEKKLCPPNSVAYICTYFACKYHWIGKPFINDMSWQLEKIIAPIIANPDIFDLYK